MNSFFISLCTLLALFLFLLAIARLTGKESGNDAFFSGSRKSPWPLVAFGMIGASISGVSVISVPGYVGVTQMTYLQMCIGFFFGYIIVAFVLLPIYYRYHLTSIYSFLQMRFGRTSHATGAYFFLFSKIGGAAVRFYLVTVVLHRLVFSPLGISWPLAVLLILLMVWAYTRKAGIRTLVYTDTLQTFLLISTVVATTFIIGRQMYPSLSSMMSDILSSPLGRIWVWDDWSSRQNFWKQFLSGIFIVIVMTGLDQDMMQKNLTCSTLRKAQKDMCSYGICFIPVNFLLLSLGVLLYSFASSQGISLPSAGDALFPQLVQEGYFGPWVTILFVLAISSAAFSSIDSALTSLTTTFCIDILEVNKKPAIRAVSLRKRVHLGMALLFFILTILFQLIGNKSVIDVIYIMASYTYGPLLGLFSFGLFTRRLLRERFVPVVAVLSPLLSYGISLFTRYYWGIEPGYELLLLNGLICFFMLWAISTRSLSR